jgi:amino acid transporter
MSTKESASSKQNISGDTAANNKKRKAGFWSVLLMVIGVQCGGMSTVWNLGKSKTKPITLYSLLTLMILSGATEGFKKLLLGHALVGLMYVLLAICFAELTSVVPFAGGSFGFCRAALGPFWGFMVGASEVLENIMKVVVCVYLMAMACNTIFETEARFTPFWILMWYTLLFGIHLRGGSFFWNTIIIMGLISIGTVLMFCIGNTKDIDVELYGQIDNSTFTGEGEPFLESLILPIWVYIGLEIVPQTCERVKDVSSTSLAKRK